MAQRYIVSDDVEHPCCYDASVLDLRSPKIEPGKAYRIAECPSREHAERIAAALNAAEPKA